MIKKFRLETLERKIKEGKIKCEFPKIGQIEIERLPSGKKEMVEVFTLKITEEKKKK